MIGGRLRVQLVSGIRALKRLLMNPSFYKAVLFDLLCLGIITNYLFLHSPYAALAGAGSSL